MIILKKPKVVKTRWVEKLRKKYSNHGCTTKQSKESHEKTFKC